MTMDSPPEPWKLYERHADLWKRVRGPETTLEHEWLERFGGDLVPGARVLDVGCGHGQPIGAHLLQSGFEVWGIDRAPTPIATARTTLPAGSWHVADMASFDLGEMFDAIIVWHSLFHLTVSEQRKVFPRLAAHAGPTCKLLFTSGPAAGSADGEFGGEVLTHHSLDPAEYRDLLATAGFTVLDYRANDPDCGDATVWLAERAAI